MTPDAWHREAQRILDREQKIEHLSIQDAISIQSSNEIERLHGGVVVDVAKVPSGTHAGFDSPPPPSIHTVECFDC